MKNIIFILQLCWLSAAFAQGDPAFTSSTYFGGLRARQIGPALMSGRVTDIDAVQSNPKIVYVASAGGGLWKSQTGGADFSPIFDDHTMSIGKITIDQAHPDTLWLGTGEPWVRNSVSIGTGIYKSTNAGREWTMMGLDKTERISDIIVHPKNSNTVFVGALGHLWNANTDRGVYKTTDGGKTWEKILYVDENTGCADLSIDPTNPDIMFASMWDYRRWPDFFRSGGPGSGLYKTTDGGKTWNKIALPGGQLGRMAIEIAPSKPNVVYLSLECDSMNARGIYRSDDAGATWKLTSNDFNSKVRPFYFARLYVDPTNAEKVYKVGLYLSVSEDGGRKFRGVGSGVHSDIHAVWVSQKNPDMVLIGTDGGAYRSLDGARLFEMFMNLPLSQFYHVAVDNATPYNVYGGLQDNGSWFAPSLSPGGIENSDWQLSYYGDGFWSLPHPTDPNIIYSEMQGGGLVRYNKKDGRAKDIQPISEKDKPEYRFNWNAPIHTSPTKPERLYFGAQYLFKSENRGDTWAIISPDLTTNDTLRQRQKSSGGMTKENSGAEMNTTIYAIAESPKNEKTIWVGTDDGNLQVTIDGGVKWTNVVANIPDLPKGTWCSFVSPSPFDAKTCFVTFDGHRNGDFTTYVYKTTDLGKTWTNLAKPLVEGHAFVVKQDLKNPQLLFLGTEFGLFISLDGGNTWARFENNFPKVAVHDLAIHPRDNALVCATHGRGIIILDDIEPLRGLTPEVVAKEFHIFPSQPAIVRYYPMTDPFGGAGNFVGPNPNQDAAVTYYMKKRHTFGKMEVSLWDAKGNFIQSVPAGKSAGLNTVILPTSLKTPKAAPTNNRMALGNSIFGPTLPDGTYTVKIEKGKEVFTTTVSIKHEDNSPYKPEDRKLQFETLMKLYKMTEDVGYWYYCLEDAEKQAEKAGAALKPFIEQSKAFRNGIVALEGDFYIDEGKALREELSLVYGGVSRFPGKPTDNQLRKTKELEGTVAQTKAKYDALLDLLKQADTKGQVKLMTFEEFKAKE
jgi:photosystem II stability/assembly factor-like uncharacterized protein